MKRLFWRWLPPTLRSKNFDLHRALARALGFFVYSLLSLIAIFSYNKNGSQIGGVWQFRRPKNKNHNPNKTSLKNTRKACSKLYYVYHKNTLKKPKILTPIYFYQRNSWPFQRGFSYKRLARKKKIKSAECAWVIFWVGFWKFRNAIFYLGTSKEIKIFLFFSRKI